MSHAALGLQSFTDFAPVDSTASSITAAADDDFFQHHLFNRPVARVARRVADGDDNFLTLDHFTEDAVAIVEMQRRRERDEELAAVGIGSGVGHREDAAFGMAQLGVEFVFELVARSAGAVAERDRRLES